MRKISLFRKPRKAVDMLITSAFLATQLLVPLSVVTAMTAKVGATKPDTLHKVTICHRTNSTTNPYSQIDVDEASVDGDSGNDNGQGDHLLEHLGPVWDANTNYPAPHNGDQWGDIIPPFYNDGVTPTNYPTLNWTTAGQAIFYNDCNPVTNVTALVTFNDQCGTASDTYTVVAKNHVSYKNTSTNAAVAAGTYPGVGSVSITAVADQGFALTGTTVFAHTFSTAACESTPTPAGEVTFVDLCGTQGDTYSVPTTAHVSYVFTGTNNVVSAGSHAGSGSVSITAVADQGFALTGTTVFAHTFTNVPCDSTEVALCHATGEGTDGKFVLIEHLSAAGAFNGHYGASHQHGNDIIPPFVFNGNTYSQNWDTAGQALFRNGCKVTVVPTAPSFNQPNCERLTGRYTIPSTMGVTYKVSLNGGTPTTTTAGTYSAPAGTTVVVTAVADDGYMLDAQVTKQWSETFVAATDCVLGDTDVCPNIEGSQATVPSGMTKDAATGNCVTTVVTGGQGGEVLSATTTAPLANTGDGSTLANIIIGITGVLMALGLTVLSRNKHNHA